MIIVDDKDVTVLSRPSLKRTRAPIERTEHLGNRCDSPGGGHAGCSITYDRYWSAAIPDQHLELGTNEGNVLHHDDGPNTFEECRQSSDYEVVATCSTATRFVIVKYQGPAYNEPPCWHLRARLWEGQAEQSRELDGDVDRAASVGDHWVFRFPAANKSLSLDFDRRTPSAVLAIGGQREDCVAFRLSAY